LNVFEHASPDTLRERAHPWHGSLADQSHRYVDLRAEPELIRTALEDFVPFAAWPATERFYALLAWLNGPDSVFETNDCAFEGPTENAGGPFEGRLCCSGRVMLLFRELKSNTRANRVEALTQRVARGLSVTDPTFDRGAVGATRVPVRFTTLPGPAARQSGQQLMLSFWAFGDDEAEAMGNLDRLFRGLSSVLGAVSAAVAAGR
jgi:hypothetical protein